MKQNGITGFLALFFSVLLFTTPTFAAETSSRNGWGWDTLLAYAKLSDVKETNITIPVLMGVELKNVYDSWGDPRSGGRSHEGNDIFAPKGTPVVSPTDAIVISIGNGKLGGNYVFTLNPGGERYYYAHLDGYAPGLFRGQVLKKGDLIGYVGNTGAETTPPHLHFGIYTSSGAVNPFPRLTQTFTTAERVEALNKIVTSAANASSTASMLGTKYKSFLKNAQAQKLVLTETLALAVSGKLEMTSEGFTSLNRTLKLGSSGTDVKKLQQFLNTHGAPIATTGVGSKGKETTYFGKATQLALMKYQRMHGITPTGTLGPVTRANIIAQGTIAVR